MKTNQTEPKVVLVVEDEFLVRAYAADVLTGSGFEVVEAKNADEALELLEELPEVKVLFTDINMPGQLDGIGLAQKVAERWPHVSRLITSGKMRPQRDEIAPPWRFIEKPYEPETVIRTVEELIEGDGDQPAVKAGRHH